MQRSKSIDLVLLALTSLAACGSVQERTSDLVSRVKDATDDLVDRANQYVEEPPLAQRQRWCDKLGGTMVDELEVGPCERGTATLTFSGGHEDQACADGDGGPSRDVCIFRDASGRVYFNDGPSVPSWAQAAGRMVDDSLDIHRWNELFWPAAVNHDYCYHHNGITRGFSHEDCDQQMLADLAAICAETRYERISWFSRDVCERNAAAAYSTVRCLGDSAFAAMNTHVDYPEWEPMWQRLDQEDQPEINGILSRDFPACSIEN